MRNDLNDLIMVIDRSGSMANCRTEAENGINAFIEDQQKAPGECRLTLVQFDTEYEFVHLAKSIRDVPKYVLNPRNSTALHDAIGRAINETGARLAAMPEDQRPWLVTVYIVTDGLENASKEFTRKQIREMINHQRSVYNWKFLFVGADENAIAQGVELGVQADASAKFATANSADVYKNLSAKNRVMRDAAFHEKEIPTSAMTFSAEERASYSEKK